MLSFKTLRTLTTSLVAGLGMAVATTAGASTLNFAIGHPSGSVAHLAGQAYAEAVQEKSEGSLTVRVFPLSLLNLAETSAGVRDGMAAVGFLLTQYFPSEYPHTNLIAESSMMLGLLEEEMDGRESMAYVGAMAEFIFFHCPGCNSEFAAQNQVFTGNGGTSPYALHCTTPVTSLADLSGKRLRTSGSMWSRWATHMGASSITMSVNDSLEALSQGVIDCDVNSAPELLNFRIIDAATDITLDVPGGIFAGVAAANVNRDSWQSASEDERTALIYGGAVMAAETTAGYLDRHNQAVEEVKKRNLNIHQADSQLVEATHEFIQQDLVTITRHFENQYGVTEAESMIAKFKELLDRWVPLVSEVENAGELAELYWEEVYSKVDINKHGF